VFPFAPQPMIWRAMSLTAILIALNGIRATADELRPAPQSGSFRLIAPALAWQGETFSGLVVADTDEGPRPLEEGDQVVFNGQVLETVRPGGIVELPPEAVVGNRPPSGPSIDNCPHCASGNIVYSGFVVRAFGKPVRADGTQLRGQVQLIAMPSETGASAIAVPPRIARLSAVITGDQPFSIFGHGLDRLREAALLAEDGSPISLGPSVGSALQRIYPPASSARLPKGTLRFVAWDEEGQRLEAPGQAKHPRLTLEGTRITRPGQPGEIKVVSDASGIVRLTGGQPQISVSQQPFPVEANVPKIAKFRSQIVGPYTVTGRIWNREDLPTTSDARRAIVDQAPIQYQYDARGNRTRVNVPVRVHDEKAVPVADSPLDMAMVHPGGVEYATATTDRLGRAMANFDLPGNVAPASLTAHVFRLAGLPWLPQEEPKCKGCSVSIVNVWADYQANAVDPKVAKVVGKSLDNLTVQWKHDGECGCKPGRVHIHTYMATQGDGKVNSNGDAGKEDIFEDANSSCTPGATGFWTKNFISGAVGLYYKGSIRVYAECHDCGAKSKVWSDDQFEKYDKLKDNDDYKKFLKKLGGK